MSSFVHDASPYDVNSRNSEKLGKAGTDIRGISRRPVRTTHPISSRPETTAATAQDVTVVEPIHQALAQQALLPTDWLKTRPLAQRITREAIPLRS